MKTYQLLKTIQFPKHYTSAFKNTELITPIYSKRKNQITFQFETYQILPLKIYQQLQRLLEKSFNCDCHVQIKSEKNEPEHALVSDYLEVIANNHQLQKTILQASTKIEGHQIVFLAINEGDQDYINQVLSLLDEQLNIYGFEVNCFCEIVEAEVKFVETTKKVTPTIKPSIEMKPQYKTKSKLEDYTMVKIAMLQEEMFNVYFEGQLFKIDSRETRKGNIIATLYFTDLEDGIETTCFVDSLDDIEIKVGQWAAVYGNYVFDNYAKQNTFKHKLIKTIESPLNYEDKADEKRIEFHAHTKASEMDGISDVSDLIKQAYDYGHPAIAITDHSVVHSFPKAQSTAAKLNAKDKNKQIKVIYGVEMNVVDDHLMIVNTDQDFDLQQQTYILFDLETTGLSSRYDHIIEFGAVKVVNQTIVDQIQLFIKPPVSIPARITSITNIDDEMVKDAPTLKEAFKTITNFIGDGVLVAHNGLFDYRFLQAAAQKCNVPELNNPLIDTLALAWALIDQRKSYTLGAVARYYNLPYDQSIAHRADYDAQILQHVFASMSSELFSKGIKTSAQLIEFQNSINPIDKLRPYHMTVLAKNQQGIKDLYKLVSLSHTDNLMFRGKSTKKEDESIAEARLTRQLIQENRHNLLIGSACFNSYLFEIARTGSQQELETEMGFYDYIELQPLKNYEPLLYKKQILNQEHLIEILKNIYFTAHKLNKLVVGTGDVHYILKHEKIFREIYINAMGIGGAKHPLYIYDEQLRQTQQSPDQHLRTTNEMLAGYPYLSKNEVKRVVIDNTHKLNSLIDDVYPVPKELYAPTIEGSDEKLTTLVYENAHAIYGENLPQIVEDRIKKELNSILSNGFGVIYYISHLLVKQSIEDGYMVGSRGSVGSSFVATMANITQVNPLVPHYVCPSCHYSEFFTKSEYASGYDLPLKECPHCQSQLIGEGQDIPFETFLGFEGDKTPDIDLNFSGDYQETAHNLTKELFGEDKVLRAGTIGTIAEKTAFGLVSGYYENVEPKEPVHNAFKEYLVLGAAGVKRSTGQHPGGIIVIPEDKDILDFMPYQYPANNPMSSWLTSHFEYHDIEHNLLKLDILGHVDPTAIKFLEDVSGLDVNKIPLNDPQTMSIFNSTDALLIDHRRQRDSNGAVGLPEFGTQFVRRMLNDTNPNKFSDLVKISGLSHGTDVWSKNAEAIIQNGYTLDDVICCRDDIMTYLTHLGVQEKMAFNIMESVRKGRGLRPEWIDAMTSKGVQHWYIESAQLIKYLFPKAHAVAYCMMGVRVAWFKVHRPLDFYAQYFTLRCTAYEIDTMLAGADAIEKRLDNILNRRQSFSIEDRVSAKEEQLINTLEVAFEMLIRGYSFKPVSLMESHATAFWPDPKDPKKLLIPFNALDGVWESVAHNIVSERDKRAFLSIEDFKKRTQITQNGLNELKKLNVLDHLSELNQLSLF